MIGAIAAWIDSAFDCDRIHHPTVVCNRTSISTTKLGTCPEHSAMWRRSHLVGTRCDASYPRSDLQIARFCPSLTRRVSAGAQCNATCRQNYPTQTLSVPGKRQRDPSVVCALEQRFRLNSLKNYENRASLTRMQQGYLAQITGKPAKNRGLEESRD